MYNGFVCGIWEKEQTEWLVTIFAHGPWQPKVTIGFPLFNSFVSSVLSIYGVHQLHHLEKVLMVSYKRKGIILSVAIKNNCGHYWTKGETTLIDLFNCSSSTNGLNSFTKFLKHSRVRLNDVKININVGFFQFVIWFEWMERVCEKI